MRHSELDRSEDVAACIKEYRYMSILNMAVIVLCFMLVVVLVVAVMPVVAKQALIEVLEEYDVQVIE